MFDTATGPYSQLSTPAATLGFPDLLSYRDGFHHVAEAPESAPVLGVDGEGNPVSVDFDNDSPHILVSAASGGGKSVIVRSVIAQTLANGGKAVFLDLKRHSHRWAKNLPNVAYAQTLPEIGNALVSIGMEVHRRNEIVENHPGPIEEAPVGERLVIGFEELNATMGQLQEMNRKLPRGSYNAMDAFRDIMFMGRAAKVHIVAVAQFATAASMGGPDIRENFSTRILIRYTKQAWTMLAYDCGLPQAAPEEAGRGMVCRGGKARQTQFLYLTEEEAAQMVRDALSEGRTAPVQSGVRGAVRRNRQGRQAKRALMNSGRTL